MIPISAQLNLSSAVQEPNSGLMNYQRTIKRLFTRMLRQDLILEARVDNSQNTTTWALIHHKN